MIYDFHSHTSLSDGQLSPVELISEAYSRGYQALCITDHAGIGYLPRLLQETSQDCVLASSHWDIMAIPGLELTHIPPGAIATLAKLARDAGAKMVVVHGETITENVKPGTKVTLHSACAILMISLAISSGERIKSTHPLAIALSGISG